MDDCFIRWSQCAVHCRVHHIKVQHFYDCHEVIYLRKDQGLVSINHLMTKICLKIKVIAFHLSCFKINVSLAYPQGWGFGVVKLLLLEMQIILVKAITLNDGYLKFGRTCLYACALLC